MNIRTNLQRLTKKVVAILIVVISITASVLMPMETEAAQTTAQMRKLTIGKTYTCYDVTGDGKKDSFRYQKGELGYTNLYIGGRYVNRVATARGSIIYWVRLTSGKVFLVVNYSLFGGHENTFLQYKGGKFAEIGGNAALHKYSLPFTDPYRVAGYSVFFKGANYKYFPKTLCKTDEVPKFIYDYSAK